MLKSLSIVSSMILYSTFAFSQYNPDRTNWTEKDYWTEVRLKFDSAIRGTFSSEVCYSSYATFSGCVNALSAGIRASKADGKYYVLKPNLQATSVSGFDVEVLVFENAKDVKVKMKAYSDSLASWYKANTSRLVTKRISFEDSMADMKKTYVNEGNESYLSGTMMNAFLEKAEDPHTYYTPTLLMMKRMQGTEQVGGSRGVIGITYKPEKHLDEEKLMIMSVLENSVAQEAGIEEGDIILSINGVEQLKPMLEEMSGKDVLEFELDGSKGRRVLRLSRKPLQTNTVSSKLYRSQDNRLFGYVKLEHFMDEKGCEKVTSAGKNLIARGAKGLILDLRDNGGGLVPVATCINDQFLEKGSLTFSEQDLSTGKFQVRKNATVGAFKDIHSVVLVNGHSASASEVVSIYLQGYRKAFIVGENSFGKGTMQSVGRLEQNPFLSLAQTVAKYYGPQGVSPQIQGVTPDVEAFPAFDQKGPTEYERERDRYDNAIVNEVKPAPIMKDRAAQVKQVKECLSSGQYAARSYEQKDEFKKKVHDNQLSVALGTLDCALNLRIPIFKSTKIPTVIKMD